MLNRRKKIQKYINALKSKRASRSSQSVLEYSLSEKQQQNQQNTEQKPYDHSLYKYTNPMEKNINTSFNFSIEEQNELQGTKEQDQELWHDSDDEEKNALKIDHGSSALKKLNLSEDANQNEYEGKLKQFYQSKYKVKNWAQLGDGEQQMDLNDYLDREENYQAVSKKDKYSSIIHIGRTHQKHESIVTGMDWHGDVLFSSGFDQKLKIWKVNSSETNPELKIKLQKDILTSKLPLSGCFFHNGLIYCGTLRKNLAIIDTQKWKINFVTSSFLSDHSTYQNLRVSQEHNKKLIFSKGKISLLDYKNGYTGSLLANNDLKDVRFGTQSHLLYGVTQDATYEWDLRTFKPFKIQKSFLGYTALQVSQQWLCTGSRLGMIYLNENNQEKDKGFPLHHENKNLTTTITSLHMNHSKNLVLALSKWKQNAARIIDTHSGKCLGDWPNVKTKIQFGSAGAFSHQSDMFAVGSTNGYINIYDFEDPK